MSGTAIVCDAVTIRAPYAVSSTDMAQNARYWPARTLSDSEIQRTWVYLDTTHLSVLRYAARRCSEIHRTWMY
eukprot:1305224-Rhodomonas_salina.3